MIQTLDLRGRRPTRAELVDLVPRAAVDVSAATEVAAALIAEVRDRGEAALRDQAERLDRVRPDAVRVDPAAIDCGATCSATIDPLAVPKTLTFTATPGDGARFAGWGGACGGSFPTCTVTIRGATTVRALFFVPSPDAGVGAGGDAGLPPIAGGSNGCCDVRGSDNRASLILLLAVAVGLRRRRR